MLKTTSPIMLNLARSPIYFNNALVLHPRRGMDIRQLSEEVLALNAQTKRPVQQIVISMDSWQPQPVFSEGYISELKRIVNHFGVPIYLEMADTDFHIIPRVVTAGAITALTPHATPLSIKMRDKLGWNTKAGIIASSILYFLGTLRNKQLFLIELRSLVGWDSAAGRFIGELNSVFDKK